MLNNNIIQGVDYFHTVQHYIPRFRGNYAYLSSREHKSNQLLHLRQYALHEVFSSSIFASTSLSLRISDLYLGMIPPFFLIMIIVSIEQVNHTKQTNGKFTSVSLSKIFEYGFVDTGGNDLR